MLWFAVWTTLVLGTLVGAALLGRNLWRKGKALLAELETASATLDTLQARVDELEATHAPEQRFVPSLLSSEDVRAGWRALRRANLDARAERRVRRRARAHRRWDDLLTPSEAVGTPRRDRPGVSDAGTVT